MAKCFIINVPHMSNRLVLFQLFILITNVNRSINQCFPIDDEDASADEDDKPSQYVIVDSDILVSRKPPVDSDRLWPNKTIPFTFHECNVSISSCITLSIDVCCFIFLHSYQRVEEEAYSSRNPSVVK